ncbi:MAG: hypothetical protein IT266_09425 [Saprospiraceae bacterium]|nr:hypothetical protein [Saprospiraceae bacterium]
MDLSAKDSLDLIIASLGLDSNTSFELLFTENDFQDTLFYYSRYQQYYKGIRVDGGGYNNDDPNCDYYSELAGKYRGTEPGVKASFFIARHGECALLSVYDIYGRLIFTSNNCFIQEQEIPYSGIAIFRYSSKDNNTIKVQKRCLVHDSNLK